MRHLVLIGFMGAGKSTVGRLVAEDLGVAFIDVDELVEKQEGRSVRTIFEQDGEARFRELESSALRALEGVSASVIACGGGVVLSEDNRALLGRLGTVVYLKVTAAETLTRIGSSGSRPLLVGEEGAAAAVRLLGEREALYSAVADVTIDTVDRAPGEIARLVIQSVRDRSAS